VVYGDARSLKQIVLNLLSNAVKFTARGGRIVVNARIDYKGRLVTTVSDNGVGIAKRDKARIFQPFIQADSSLSRKYEGTGLGLPLTKSLVELHDGELELKSKEGAGTTVKVIFPKERVIGPKTAAAAE
jgi:signal transduction histidine kinase